MNTSDSISSIFTSNSSPPQSTDSSLEAVNQNPFPCPCRCHHRPHPQTHHRHHNHHIIHHHRQNNTLDSPNESGISPPSPSSDQVDNATTTPPVHKTTSRPPRLIKSSQPINIFSSSSASHRHRTPLYDSDSVIDENIEFDSAPKRHIVEPPKNITINHNQSQPKSLCDCHRRLLIIYNNYNSDSNKIISFSETQATNLSHFIDLNLHQVNKNNTTSKEVVFNNQHSPNKTVSRLEQHHRVIISENTSTNNIIEDDINDINDNIKNKSNANYKSSDGELLIKNSNNINNHVKQRSTIPIIPHISSNQREQIAPNYSKKLLLDCYKPAILEKEIEKCNDKKEENEEWNLENPRTSTSNNINNSTTSSTNQSRDWIEKYILANSSCSSTKDLNENNTRKETPQTTTESGRELQQQQLPITTTAIESTTSSKMVKSLILPLPLIYTTSNSNNSTGSSTSSSSSSTSSTSSSDRKSSTSSSQSSNASYSEYSNYSINNLNTPTTMTTKLSPPPPSPPLPPTSQQQQQQHQQQLQPQQINKSRSTLIAMSNLKLDSASSISISNLCTSSSTNNISNHNNTNTVNNTTSNTSTTTNNATTTGMSSSHVGFMDQADDSSRLRRQQLQFHRRHNSSCNLSLMNSATNLNNIAGSLPTSNIDSSSTSSHTCCHHHYCHNSAGQLNRAQTQPQQRPPPIGAQNRQFLTIPNNIGNWSPSLSHLDPPSLNIEECEDENDESSDNPTSVQLCNNQLYCRNATRSLCQSRSASIAQSPATFLSTAAILRSFAQAHAARSEAASSTTLRRSQNEIKIIDDNGVLLSVDDETANNTNNTDEPNIQINKRATTTTTMFTLEPSSSSTTTGDEDGPSLNSINSINDTSAVPLSSSLPSSSQSSPTTTNSQEQPPSLNKRRQLDSSKLSLLIQNSISTDASTSSHHNFLSPGVFGSSVSSPSPSIFSHSGDDSHFLLTPATADDHLASFTNNNTNRNYRSNSCSHYYFDYDSKTNGIESRNEPSEMSSSGLTLRVPTSASPSMMQLSTDASSTNASTPLAMSYPTTSYRKASMQEPSNRLAATFHMNPNNNNMMLADSTMSLAMCCSRCCLSAASRAATVQSTSNLDESVSSSAGGDLSYAESLPELTYFKSHLLFDETSIQSAPARTGEVLLKNFDRAFNNTTSTNSSNQVESRSSTFNEEDDDQHHSHQPNNTKTDSGTMLAAIMIDDLTSSSVGGIKSSPTTTTTIPSGSNKTSKVVTFETGASIGSDSESSGGGGNANRTASPPLTNDQPAAVQVSLCRRLFRQKKTQQQSQTNIVIGPSSCGGKSSTNLIEAATNSVADSSALIANSSNHAKVFISPTNAPPSNSSWFRAKQKQNSSSTSALDALAKKKSNSSSSSSLTRVRTKSKDGLPKVERPTTTAQSSSSSSTAAAPITTTTTTTNQTTTTTKTAEPTTSTLTSSSLQNSQPRIRLFDFYSYYNNKINQESRNRRLQLASSSIGPSGAANSANDKSNTANSSNATSAACKYHLLHHHHNHCHHHHSSRNKAYFSLMSSSSSSRRRAHNHHLHHHHHHFATISSSAAAATLGGGAAGDSNNPADDPLSCCGADSPASSSRLLTNANVKAIASNLAKDIKSKATNLLRRRHTDASFTDKSLLPSREEVYKWQSSFENLLRHKYGIALFRGFLKTEFSDENIEFWLECEDYKYTNKEIKRLAKSKKIYSDFVAIGSPREVNLDIEIRAHTAQNILNPTTDTFERAQKRIQALMEKDSYPRFLESDLYKNLLASAYPPLSSSSPSSNVVATAPTTSQSNINAANTTTTTTNLSNTNITASSSSPVSEVAPTPSAIAAATTTTTITTVAPTTSTSSSSADLLVAATAKKSSISESDVSSGKVA